MRVTIFLDASKRAPCRIQVYVSSRQDDLRGDRYHCTLDSDVIYMYVLIEVNSKHVIEGREGLQIQKHLSMESLDSK